MGTRGNGDIIYTCTKFCGVFDFSASFGYKRKQNARLYVSSTSLSLLAMIKHCDCAVENNKKMKLAPRASTDGFARPVFSTGTSKNIY